MKLSRKHVDIGPEHVGHTIRFVEVCDPSPADGPGIVCVVCGTCGNPADDDDVMLLALIEDPETVAEIVAEMGQLKRVYIEPGAGVQ